MIPYTEESYRLLHDGAIALAEVESNGIRIDEEYLGRTILKCEEDIKVLEQGIRDSDVVKTWRRKFGASFNLGSQDQLGTILFEVMGFECVERTGTGKPKTDEKTLSAVDNPFVQDYLKIKKLKKTLSTYLRGIQREIVDGFIHPSFNLHLVTTYRSSCDSPNFQNIPIRNPETGKLIRTAIIARPGRRLVELDYGGIEIAVAATYHNDPNMHAYLRDKTKDLHRDMAMACFKLPLRDLTGKTGDSKDAKRAKDIRYCGKNMFVFPEFYGDWYIDCARDLWKACSTMKLRRRDGTNLIDHLAEQGIDELGDCDPREDPRSGTFEAHLRSVEKNFWGKMFPVYARWKREWVERYMKQGWMLTNTGFICQGRMKKNEIVNYPVQGSAFHCLLWALIQLVRTELKKAKMKTLIVGQIHDSLLADVPDEELDDYLGLAQEVMVDKLLAHWEWLNVPMEIEAEVTPVEGSWYQKEKWEIPS